MVGGLFTPDWLDGTEMMGFINEYNQLECEGLTRTVSPAEYSRLARKGDEIFSHPGYIEHMGTVNPTLRTKFMELYTTCRTKGKGATAGLTPEQYLTMLRKGKTRVPAAGPAHRESKPTIHRESKKSTVHRESKPTSRRTSTQSDNGGQKDIFIKANPEPHDPRNDF